MSEAAAINHAPDFTSMRRWERYHVNVPIRVIVSRAMKASIFDGRGTSVSEGGMALFAGAELRPGDQVAVEFTPPFSSPPIRVDARICNRTGYHYGVEFDYRQCPKAKRGPASPASVELYHHGLRRPPVKSGWGGENGLQVSAEAAQHFQPLRGGVNQFLFSLKDRAAFPFGEHPDGLSHAPPGGAEHLQAID